MQNPAFGSVALALAALMALPACDSLPVQNYLASEDLVRVDGAVDAADGLYIPLRAGLLAFVTAEGPRSVDLGFGVVQRLLVSPAGQAVAVVHTTRCQPDDPKEARGLRYVSECPSDDREVLAELVTLIDGEVASRAPIHPWNLDASFSEDGKWAVTWFSPVNGELPRGSIVDLTSVQVVDLQAGVTTPVTVGFAADRVLFTPDGARAVALSDDSVVVIELAGAAPERGTAFPLTLDPDQVVRPVGVSLTPDGSYALITAASQDDLYVLRLDRPSVNLVNLSGVPAAMQVVDDSDPDDGVELDRTVVVHQNAARVDVIDHDNFDVTSIILDQRVSRILHDQGRTLLYDTAGGKDVYLLDLASNKVVEFRTENPPQAAFIAPGGEFAIVTTGPETGSSGETEIQRLFDGYPGFEVLDLRDARGRSTPYLAEDTISDVAFQDTETGPQALILQQRQDYLYRLDLRTGLAEEVELRVGAAALGAAEAGSWWILHQAGYGLVSYFDATTSEVVEVGGFGIWAIDAEPELAPAQEEGS
jgi:DNA-binding beta-propeller fold protein YncE